MKKSPYKTVHQLLIATAIFLITLQVSLANANSYSDKNSDSFTKIEKNHKPSSKLPEGGFICNGEIVIVAKIIRRHLSCKENIVSSILVSQSYEL